MCGRFTLGREPDSLLDYFHLHGEVPAYHLSWNIAPSQQVPVIVFNANRERVCQLMLWGLVPHWVKQPDTQHRLINARCETVAEKPSFRDAFRLHRCLVPADGFYEWQQSGPYRQPYYIYRQDQGLFAMAGIWAHWQQGEQSVASFAIITTTANKLMSTIHHRMPCIVEPANYDHWLDPRTEPGHLDGIMQEPANNELAMHPVSSMVNSTARNGIELIGRADPVSPGLF